MNLFFHDFFNSFLRLNEGYIAYFEIDVIALRDYTIFFIDVKHWKRTTDHKSSLCSAAEFQSLRAVNFCEDTQAIRLFFETIQSKQNLNKKKKQIRRDNDMKRIGKNKNKKPF